MKLKRIIRRSSPARPELPTVFPGICFPLGDRGPSSHWEKPATCLRLRGDLIGATAL